MGDLGEIPASDLTYSELIYEAGYSKMRGGGVSIVDENKRGITRSVQRRLNILDALAALNSKPQTVLELAAKVNISRPAMESVMTDLAKLGWVEPVEPAPGIGRPAVRWCRNAHALHFVGLQICVRKARVIVADFFGEPMVERVVDIDLHTEAEDRIAILINLVRETVAEAGLEISDIAICAVASPGVIDKGVVLHYSGPGLPGWVGLDLEARFRDAFHLKVAVSGYCALGALGEVWKGAAVGHRDVVYVHCGPNQIGAAAVIGGRVLAGYRGAAGLIGELPELRWQEIANDGFCRPDDEGPWLTGMFERARKGDPEALARMHSFNEALALGTAALVLAIAPSKVIIGGGLIKFADIGLPSFRDELARICPVLPEIYQSNLENRAVVLGAIRLALHLVWDELQDIVYSQSVVRSPEQFAARLAAKM